MSVSAIASLRPLHSQCLRRAPTHGLLSLRIQSRTASLNFRAVVALPTQKRCQSSENDAQKENKSAKEAKKEERMKLTFRQFFGRALTSSLRNLAYASSPRGIRHGIKENPISTSLILALLIASFIFGAVQIRLFYKTFYNPEFSKYPEPVRNTLRRAIYHTVVRPDPELALKYYNRAMAEAMQVGLDPYSDEVLGIRIMVAFFLEKIDNFKQSTDVLESILRDCMSWVEEMEKQAKEGNVDETGRLVNATPAIEAPRPPMNPRPEESDAPETMWRRRERLLAKAVSISVKLGELYADEHVLDPENSHKHLVWSVETTLKEFRRRREEKPNPGEEKWLTPTEVGATMESLGRNYERKSQFHLAIPLFFQALRNCDSPCHRAVIMNNLAACFAQHPIYSPLSGGNPETESMKDLFASSMPNTRKDCLEAAANWAQNAYTHGNDVKGEERTPECDEACAVALCNWGDVVAMQGNKESARRKYEQAIELSSKLDFKAGVTQAQEGLKRLMTPLVEKKPKQRAFR